MTQEHLNFKTLEVYNFSNYREFLISACMPNGLYSHSSNNLASWAKRLGYKSPSSLSMVLKGQRHPSKDMMKALCELLALDEEQSRYFALLVELEKTKERSLDFSKIQEEIHEIQKKNTSFNISLKEFSLISEWYYIAIKQLINTGEFINDLVWIEKRLKKKVSKVQIKKAINDLLDLGYIAKTEDGNLKTSAQRIITTQDVPSKTIQIHHKEMLLQALDSLDEETCNRRQFSSLTLCFDEERAKEAKDEIHAFIKEFNNKFASGENRNEVYQLGFQFFPHTKPILKH